MFNHLNSKERAFHGPNDAFKSRRNEDKKQRTRRMLDDKRTREKHEDSRTISSRY